MKDASPQLPETGAQQWDVFICYRQVDGSETAKWLYQHLHGQPLPATTGPAPRIHFYMDQHAAAVSDWRKLNRAAMEKARAMVVVCTPGSAVDEGPDDEVQKEIHWWIDNRRTAPILVDAFGTGTRYVPKLIKERWPHAQLVKVNLREWAKEDKAELAASEERAVSRIVQGVLLSEGQVRDEELAEAVRLRKELEIALAEAERQRNLASAALLAAQGELLIEEGIWAAAQCGALLVFESLQRVPSTLQGHRAWAKAMSFFPPQIDGAELPAANKYRVAAISIGLSGRLVAVGSKDRTVVHDVETQSSYWYSHKGTVQVVALDPTGKYLATRAEGETVRVWSLKTKELLHEWPNNERALSLLFGNSGWLLASCDFSESKLIRLWDCRLKREDQPLDCFEMVYSLGAFSSKDDYVTALVDHGQLEEDVVVGWKLSGPERGRRLAGYLKGGGLVDVAFSADDSLIATSGYQYFAEVRPFTGEEAISSPTYVTQLRGGAGQAIAFDPNGGYVAIAGKDRVRLWDFRSEREVGTIQHPDVKDLAFNADGAVLTTVTSNDVRRWAVGCGRNLGRKVQSAKKPLEPAEVVDMIPSMRDRIGRDLTEMEKAEYIPTE